MQIGKKPGLSHTRLFRKRIRNPDTEGQGWAQPKMGSPPLPQHLLPGASSTASASWKTGRSTHSSSSSTWELLGPYSPQLGRETRHILNKKPHQERRDLGPSPGPGRGYYRGSGASACTEGSGEAPLRELGQRGDAVPVVTSNEAWRDQMAGRALLGPE